MESEGFNTELFARFAGNRRVGIEANLGKVTAGNFRSMSLSDQIEKANNNLDDYHLEEDEIDHLAWDKGAKILWVKFKEDVDRPYTRDDHYADTHLLPPKERR